MSAETQPESKSLKAWPPSGSPLLPVLKGKPVTALSVSLIF